VRTWLSRRLLLALPTLLGLTIVTFLLSRLAPGGPLTDLLGAEEGRALTREQLETTERLLGLDRPLHEQYLSWLGRFARLDFGESLLPDHRPVREKIVAAFGVSVALQAAAVLLMYGLGIPLGILGAAREGSRFDRLLGAGLFLLHSMPTLLLGAVLIALFCSGPLASLPMTGLSTPGLRPGSSGEALADLLRHAALPVTCLALAGLAGVARYARAGVLEALRQPYIQAARARGLPERRVLARHALRNGILPVVTMFASAFPSLVGGSVAVETLFSIPGLGRLSTDSILTRDYPTVMALSVIVGVATLLGFLVTDLLYVALRRRTELS
jgi:peptide/nickel transport system permease protein